MRTVLIKYEKARMHFGKLFWSGIFEDTLEGYDYNSKNQLKCSAEADGYKWKVLRIHRDGSTSIIEAGPLSKAKHNTSLEPTRNYRAKTDSLRGGSVISLYS